MNPGIARVDRCARLIKVKRQYFAVYRDSVGHNRLHVLATNYTTVSR